MASPPLSPATPRSPYSFHADAPALPYEALGLNPDGTAKEETDESRVI